MTYTATVDPDNAIGETDETNNDATSNAYVVTYNGYKGKRYWNGGSDFTTRATYDLNGGIVSSTHNSSTYKGVGWKSQTETWTAGDLPLPAGSAVEKVYLYLPYNWDTTLGGVPIWTAKFNGNLLTGETPYTDKSNFGSFASYQYGLYRFDVTGQFNPAGNTLAITPGAGNKNALYPSTLLIIYRDASATRKLIFLNEECDELAVSDSSYGTTVKEATAYVPFSGDDPRYRRCRERHPVQFRRKCRAGRRQPALQRAHGGNGCLAR